MEKRIIVLTEDNPIQGQKWCCLSMISPESRQKCSVHGLKIRFVCDASEDAESMAKQLRDSDPDFDVYVAPVGKWIPWIWAPEEIKNAKYANEQLTELVATHKAECEKADVAFQQRIQHELKENRTQEKIAPKESIYSIHFKIKQLEHVILHRQAELEKLQSLFNSDEYSDEERENALPTYIPIY